jgi:hypothetical protein
MRENLSRIYEKQKRNILRWIGRANRLEAAQEFASDIISPAPVFLRIARATIP